MNRKHPTREVMENPLNQPQPSLSSPIQDEHLEQMAEMMAAALAQLECPDCCGPVYQFIEVGATVHQEEMEWACVVQVVQSFRSRSGK